MHEVLQFIAANKTTILVASGWVAGFFGWVFSCAASSMPPLPDNATYRQKWAHDFVQLIAANPHKMILPKTQPKESLQ